MPDELNQRAKYRVKTDAHNWILERSYVGRGKDNKPSGETKWKTCSYHSSLANLLVYLFDALMKEGYRPGGVERLRDLVTLTEKRIYAYGKLLGLDREAELDIKDL